MTPQPDDPDIDGEVLAASRPSVEWARQELERLARELGLRQRVLVVEDEADSGDLIAMFLGRRGHSCTVARNVAEALARIEEQEPDVVLLDLVLPDGEGWDVAARLREMASRCRVVAVTGWTDRVARERAEREGFDGYFLKPTEMRDVLRIIEGE